MLLGLSPESWPGVVSPWETSAPGRPLLWPWDGVATVEATVSPGRFMFWGSFVQRKPTPGKGI